MDPTNDALVRLGWALYEVGRYRYLDERGDHYITRRLQAALLAA